MGHKLTTPIEELIGKGKNAITMDRVDVDKVCAYCCEDSDVTYRLKKILEKDIADKGLDELFYKVEMPLVEVLAMMEINGVCLDTPFLAELSSEMEKKLEKLTKKIYELAGEEFNINSPKQLSSDTVRETEASGHKEDEDGHIDRRGCADEARAFP